MNRREFLAAAIAAPVLSGPEQRTGPALLDPNRLAKFVGPLPIPPVARVSRTLSHRAGVERSLPVYRFALQEIQNRVHRDLLPTTMWGVDCTSPGPTIEARKGEPLVIEWVNSLPAKHLLPVDHSLSGTKHAGSEVRSIFHLHGGRVPPESDGYPENWYEPGKPILTYYPNQQDAALLWYHDHAMSITRLNVMAGLFGLYVIRDETEDSLMLPRARYEIPLILYDRSFRSDGQLYYPVSGNPAKPWVTEFFGDVVLVNGALFPYLNVENRQYRFRLVNASNSRFLYLSLSNGQSFDQIGSDQGLLAAPVTLRILALAPGERADILVDFTAGGGREIVLQSDTFSLLQFRVSNAIRHPKPQALITLSKIERIPETSAVRTRLLTLEDGGDPDDPTTNTQPMLLCGKSWHDPVSETVLLNSIEIWSFVNLTDDSHPIHLHLVRFQVLDRRPFDLFVYLNERELRYTGDPIPPEANELGWKDTVRADPGMVTRIIIRFEGFAGRYVWHCHVLEHEDYEMMRPYDVVT